LQTPEKINKEGITMSSPLASQLTQRFFRYLAISSQSDPRATTLPTTPGNTRWPASLPTSYAALGWTIL
jgi:tripeptide aminopeptidase